MLVSWRVPTYTPFKHLEAHMERTMYFFLWVHHSPHRIGWLIITRGSLMVLEIRQCPLLWLPARCSHEVTLSPTVMEKEYDVWQVHITHLPCSELEKKQKHFYYSIHFGDTLPAALVTFSILTAFAHPVTFVRINELATTRLGEW